MSGDAAAHHYYVSGQNPEQLVCYVTGETPQASFTFSDSRRHALKLHCSLCLSTPDHYYWIFAFHTDHHLIFLILYVLII